MKKYLTVSFLVIFFNCFSQDNCNCCSENHKAFDFWVGEWNVYDPGGKFVGSNKIDKVQDDCVLRENWTSASPGYTGTSYNFYNPQNNQWEQIWIDNQGNPLHLKGNKKGNQMILSSDEIINNQGQKYINKVTWTHNEDGTVRQHWESSTDSGHWTTIFDGLYKRAGKE